MSITRSGPVRVVGHSHPGGCGSSAFLSVNSHTAQGSTAEEYSRGVYYSSTAEYSEQRCLRDKQGKKKQ